MGSGAWGGASVPWVALSFLAACGAENGAVCDVGDDCASQYCFTEDPNENQGVCQDPPAACEDDVTCDCAEIGDSCGSGYICVSQTKVGVSIVCE